MRLLSPLALIVVLASRLSAVEPVLVTDINREGGGIGGTAVLGGLMLAGFGDTEHGQELWVSDGTEAGTRVLVDINPGPEGSGPMHLTTIGDVVWFSADDGSNGREAWISDGTVGGTRRVSDLAKDASAAQAFTAVGERVFFVAETAAGPRLFVSDGTIGGTEQAASIAVASVSSIGFYPRLAAIGGQCIFLADDGSTGREWWLSDGSGADLVKDIANGSGSLSMQTGPVSDGQRIYFTASVSDGFEPWVSDGTSAGTYQLGDLNKGSASAFPVEYTPFDGAVFFACRTTSEARRRLWISDGSDAELFAGHSSPGVVGLAVANGALYFSDPVGLWRLDASDGTPVLLSDKQNAQNVVALDDDTIAFLASAGSGPAGKDHRLYISDGTPATTVEVSSLAPTGPGVDRNGSSLQGAGGGVVFAVVNYENEENVLIGSNGSAVGTTILLVPTIGPANSRPEDLVVLGDEVLFTATPTTAGSPSTKLYRGSLAAGVSMVTDIRPEPDGWGFVDEVANTTVVGNRVFMGARDGSSGLEPWVTDGTETGTRLLKDISPGSQSMPRAFRDLNGIAIFAATAASNFTGHELWRSDGTAVGTELVKDIWPDDQGKKGSDPREGLVIGSLMYFTADDGSHGRELWVSDGTAAGTTMVRDINSGSSDGMPHNPDGRVYVRDEGSSIVALGGQMYFPANDGSGFELWTSDGTQAGTTKVVDLGGASDAQVSRLTVLGNRILFRATDGSSGEELWITDGTAAGTRLLKDIHDGGDSEPSWLTRCGDQVFFVADDGINGHQLWVTDGTSAGTRLTAISASAAKSRRPTHLVAVGDICCFVADDGVYGHELWQSDGTGAGTFRVTDGNPGPVGSDVFSRVGLETGQLEAAVIGTTLYFPMSTPATGLELWAYEPVGASAPVPRRITIDVQGRSGIEAALESDGRFLAVPATCAPYEAKLDVSIQFRTDGSAADG